MHLRQPLSLYCNISDNIKPQSISKTTTRTLVRKRSYEASYINDGWSCRRDSREKGDAVADGMEVAILESMKMQLPVQANAAGKVLEVKANSGDFVNEGDALLVLE